MSTQVVILKMIDGTEILTTVSESAGTYFCRDILQLVTDVDERGQGRMGLLDFMPYADKEAGFAVPSAVTSLAFPSEELLNHYNERFKKIIVPPTKLTLV
jgi:pyrrolidone-carboxylate peptidase